MHRLAFVFALATFAAPAAVSQTREPIIDMHMHALAANAQGPPPMGMCTPINPMPAWDPIAPYPQTFVGMAKKPPCADPIWSPTTDLEVMTRTLEVMKRHNIIGVVSGPAARVDAWLAADGSRFIAALEFQLGGTNVPSPAALR